MMTGLSEKSRWWIFFVIVLLVATGGGGILYLIALHEQAALARGQASFLLVEVVWFMALVIGNLIVFAAYRALRFTPRKSISPLYKRVLLSIVAFIVALHIGSMWMGHQLDTELRTLWQRAHPELLNRR